MDLSPIGRTAAELMESLEADLRDEQSIGVVVVVVEIRSEEITTIRYICSDSRAWIQRALLREALDVAEDPDADRHDDGLDGGDVGEL